MTRFFLLAALAVSLAACDSNGSDDAEVGAVFVLNQGAFGNDASGSVTTYDPVTGSSGSLAAPGGLVQGAEVRDDRLYLLLNFSDSFSSGRGRLDVIDVGTGATLSQTDLGTPRGIAFLGGRAFVTDLYSAGVTPVDLATGAASAPIPVGDNPEGIVATGARVYAVNSGFGFGSTLSVIDPSSNTESEVVDLGCSGPNEILPDGDGDLWVMCTGRSDFTTGQVVADGQVVVVDAATLEIEERFTFEGELLGGAALGQDAAFDADRGELYVVQGRAGTDDTVLRFNTRANEMEAEIPVSGADVSGVGVAGGQIYLARLNPDNPFSDNGSVTVHDLDGTQVASFGAGVIPAGFAFARD